MAFLREFNSEHGFMPSLREIGARFGITTLKGVTQHLDALERKQCIVRHNSIPRGITIIKALDPQFRIVEDKLGRIKVFAPSGEDVTAAVSKIGTREAHGNHYAQLVLKVTHAETDQHTGNGKVYLRREVA
jgi:SOS-response transcriptional repressor LexA